MTCCDSRSRPQAAMRSKQAAPSGVQDKVWPTRSRGPPPPSVPGFAPLGPWAASPRDQTSSPGLSEQRRSIFLRSAARSISHIVHQTARRQMNPRFNQFSEHRHRSDRDRAECTRESTDLRHSGSSCATIGQSLFCAVRGGGEEAINCQGATGPHGGGREADGR